MAVQSDNFGGLQLSGEDATAFRNQVRNGRPNARARDSARRGLVAVAQYLRAQADEIDRLNRG